MANHKSAEKRARQNIKRNARNKAKSSRVKTTIKKLREALVAKDKTKAQSLLMEAQSQLAKLCKTNIVKKKNASRKTSRLAAALAKI
ncbi:MAG: 30S ribosomal protein S20 [Bacteriovoracaceae bacterium]|nr:30S ribosomal protein S20 [Bacteriovoracaceae bacterium]